jgi:carbon monoxide dehydrogenase subunit G
MISVERTISVPVPRDEAFRRVADFGRAHEWDPGLASSSQETPGDPGLGTSFAIVAEFRGKATPMTYVITEWDPTSRLVITGTGEKAKALDTITFADAADGGTTITYAAELGLAGALKFAEPFLNKTFAAMADKAVEGLAAWLSESTTT